MAQFKLEKVLNWGTPYAPEMQTGEKHEGPRWDTLRQQVRDAEGLGYDTVLGVETQHDPFLTLAIAAQEPAKIELGTGIALAFTKSPVATAYIAWDLQAMSGGRFWLGLGSQVKGHVTRRFGMPWSKPAQRMKDYVNAMRACWNTWQTGAPLDFHSEHYNMSLMTPNFAPPPLTVPHIPVMIAAVQERMLQVASKVCDGVRLHGIVTRQYIDQIAIPNLKKGFAKSGRPAAVGTSFSFRAAASFAPPRIGTRSRRRLRRSSRPSRSMAQHVPTARASSLADGNDRPRSFIACPCSRSGPRWPRW
jgi:alkanesulfonate monooxygenase SsuD/methylene tetrahydromethanopterin reductase-like flavin-dependent oxidoreductase (luciferase family)